MMQGMVIDMEEARLQTLAQVRAFLDGTTEMAFRVPKAERNQFIERVLKRFGFAPRFTRISIAVHRLHGLFQSEVGIVFFLVAQKLNHRG